MVRKLNEDPAIHGILVQVSTHAISTTARFSGAFLKISRVLPAAAAAAVRRAADPEGDRRAQGRRWLLRDEHWQPLPQGRVTTQLNLHHDLISEDFSERLLVVFSSDPPLAVPCTPAGCIELLQRSGYADLSGKNAVVIGRSNIV